MVLEGEQQDYAWIAELQVTKSAKMDGWVGGWAGRRAGGQAGGHVGGWMIQDSSIKSIKVI